MYLYDTQKLLKLLLPLREWREKVLRQMPIGNAMSAHREVLVFIR